MITVDFHYPTVAKAFAAVIFSITLFTIASYI